MSNVSCHHHCHTATQFRQLITSQWSVLWTCRSVYAHYTTRLRHCARSPHCRIRTALPRTAPATPPAAFNRPHTTPHTCAHHTATRRPHTLPAARGHGTRRAAPFMPHLPATHALAARAAHAHARTVLPCAHCCPPHCAARAFTTLHAARTPACTHTLHTLHTATYIPPHCTTAFATFVPHMPLHTHCTTLHILCLSPAFCCIARCTRTCLLHTHIARTHSCHTAAFHMTGCSSTARLLASGASPLFRLAGSRLPAIYATA